MPHLLFVNPLKIGAMFCFREGTHFRLRTQNVKVATKDPIRFDNSGLPVPQFSILSQDLLQQRLCCACKNRQSLTYVDNSSTAGLKQH